MIITADIEDVPCIMEALIAASRHLSSEKPFCEEVCCWVVGKLEDK